MRARLHDPSHYQLRPRLKNNKRMERFDRQPILGVRAEFVPTDDQRCYVRKLVACSITQAEICALIINPLTAEPIGLHTLRSAFARELETGLLEANIAVTHALFNKAIGRPSRIIEEKIIEQDGNVQITEKTVDRGAEPDLGAQIWWEKTRRGIREVAQLAPVDKDGNPVSDRTVIILPAKKEYVDGRILDITPSKVVDVKPEPEPDGVKIMLPAKRQA